jgi:hypothetical protein
MVTNAKIMNLSDEQQQLVYEALLEKSVNVKLKGILLQLLQICLVLT